jgi:hypothetical protein
MPREIDGPDYAGIWNVAPAALRYAHDLDGCGAWAGLVIHGTFDPPSRRYAVGTVYLRGQGSGAVRAVHGIDRLADEVGGVVVESRLTDALHRLVTGVRVEMG